VLTSAERIVFEGERRKEKRKEKKETRKKDDLAKKQKVRQQK